MNYRLRENPKAKPEQFAVFSDILSSLLVQRGITSLEEANKFISPDYELGSHDPFLMRDMERSVERVYRAIKNGEKIVIYSDYDADGIPGAVVLHDAFKKLGVKNFENYIPHRHNEGFGLHEDAITEFGRSGVKLLITIDCGIGDAHEVAHANSLGIDVIVTDHHEPPENLPPAYAILNPKLRDCSYPEKMLCGSGVIFKFVQAFFAKYGAEFGLVPGAEKWFLDMVGIATLSDMVPLVGENRTFAYYGLKVLKKSLRPGLAELFSKLRLKRENLTEDDIGFTISPRINAASRMGEPVAAFNLLSTGDSMLAATYAEALERVNNERKGTVASLVKEIRKVLAERNVGEKSVIVLGNPTWRPSLLGLVANTFADEYGKPVFLWGRDGDNIIKGSCRSGRSASVYAIMQKAADNFLHYGGHAYSGGFEVKDDLIHTLEESLEKAFRELDHRSVEAKTDVDAEISLDDVSWNLYRDVEKLSPYGTGNTKPLFMIKNAHIYVVKSFGKEANHTELILLDTKNRKVSAIRFFFPTSKLATHVVAGGRVNLVAHLEKSTFKNYPELRLRIVDIL